MTSRQLASLVLSLALLGPACGGGGEDGTGPSRTVASGLLVATEPSPGAGNRSTIPRQPVVQLVDAAGLHVAMAGIEVHAEILSGGGELGGTLAVPTDDGGKAQFTDLVISGAAGPRRLRFSATGLASDTSGTIQLVAGLPVALVAVGADSVAGVVGEELPAAPTVRLLDQDGNSVAGVPVRFVVLSGGGDVPSAPVITGDSGLAAPSAWTLGPALGPQRLEARVATPALTRLFTAVAAPGLPSVINVVAGAGQHTTVATAFPARPSIRITDRYAHPLAGVVVHFSAGMIGTVADADQVTDIAGIATAGVWTASEFAAPHEVQVGSPAMFTGLIITAYADPGPPDHINCSCGFLTDSLFVPTGYAIDDDRYEVEDRFGNPIPGADFSLTPSAGGSVTPMSGVTNNQGLIVPQQWVLSRTPGLQTLTLSVGTVTVTRKAFAHLGRILTKVSGDSQSVEVGTVAPDPPVVRLIDSAGIPVPGIPVLFATEGPFSGSLAGGTVRTDQDGLAAGPAWTVGTNLRQGSSIVAVTRGLPVAHFGALLRAGPAVALQNYSDIVGSRFVGTTPADIPVVRVIDRYENGVPGLALAWQVNGGGTLTTPSPVTDSLGFGRAAWTLGPVPGVQSVDVNAAGFAAPLNVHLDVRPGPADAFEVLAGDGQTAPVRRVVPVNPRFRLIDRFHNPMPDWLVTIAPDLGGQSTILSGVTNPSGEITTTWTLGAFAGAQSLRISEPQSGVTAAIGATATAPPPASMVALTLGSPGSTVGLLSPVPLGVRVTDADGFGAAGVTVSYAVTGGGGGLAGSTAVTDTGGVARLSGWTLGSGGNTVTATVAGLAGQSAVFRATGTPATSGFNITINYLAPPSSAVQQAFTNAAARWAQVITGDVPNQFLSVPANTCFQGQAAFSTTVDDLLLLVSVQPIDGVGGILGGTGVCVFRGFASPAIAIIQLDSDDLQAFASYVPDIVLHEIGHALGLGGGWQAFSLVTGAGSSTPRYIGEAALLGYWAVRGAPGAFPDGVPLETTGGQGTRDVHWAETTFGAELMTGFVNLPPNPMSLVTTGSLQDLGYQVNNAAADLGYTTASLRAQAARGGQIPLREVPWNGPSFTISPDGTLIPR